MPMVLLFCSFFKHLAFPKHTPASRLPLGDSILQPSPRLISDFVTPGGCSALCPCEALDHFCPGACQMDTRHPI
ncbi:hypothetical protein BDY17DRAFT_71260 [Neohortaea acidophila]|uniref:Uncharacterized protein n=1 Tax=Neohortaea acidophila TaxID=245834 RepID=A0A6A6Q1G0_9PEZI|nr:uncharacterized protein BDY17DRAFT_71260 [Neohortaea acidophila]KAF2486122.1 hypothetical protein BDY17DRAFT_71260 [Neohortaea acidophila]